MIKTNEIGYIELSKDTPIPETIQDIKLRTTVGGPIDTTVMKPFQTRISAVTVIHLDESKSLTEESQQAVFEAYQNLLTVTRRIVSGARGRFVLYLYQEQDHLDYRLVGKLYKL